MKTCLLCHKEIPEAAKICPVCRCGQTRGAVSLRSQRGITILFVLFGLFMIALPIYSHVLFQRMTARHEPRAEHTASVKVTDVRLAFGPDDSGRSTVTVSGTLTAAGPPELTAVRLELDFREADGQLHDVFSGDRPSRLPAGVPASFKVVGDQLFPAASYLPPTVRVYAVATPAGRE